MSSCTTFSNLDRKIRYSFLFEKSIWYLFSRADSHVETGDIPYGNEKTPGLKMYFLLKLGIFHSYDGLPEGTRLPGCPWKFVTS